MVMKNLVTYEGQFLENAPGGQGKLTVPGQCYYEGAINFDNDKFTITGKLVNIYGHIKEGTFTQDMIDQMSNKS